MDGVQAYKLWRETHFMLTRYERRAREGKDLDAGLEFARYVIWSGVVNVVNASAHLSPIAIDAAHLQWKAEELQRTVQGWYRSGKAQPQIAMAEVEAINHKLDLIAGRIARL